MRGARAWLVRAGSVGSGWLVLGLIVPLPVTRDQGHFGTVVRKLAKDDNRHKRVRVGSDLRRHHFSNQGHECRVVLFPRLRFKERHKTTLATAADILGRFDNRVPKQPRKLVSRALLPAASLRRALLLAPGRFKDFWR
jgi:hypothetical protein